MQAAGGIGTSTIPGRKHHRKNALHGIAKNRKEDLLSAVIQTN